MAQCPFCGTAFSSVTAIATASDQTAHNVRKRLRAGKMGGLKLDQRWVVTSSTDPGRPTIGRCPCCGAKFVSPAGAALQLQISRSGVQKILQRRPEWLMAFKVGKRRWLIPERGIQAYQKLRAALEKGDQDEIQRALQMYERSIQGGQCSCKGVRTRAGRLIRPHRWGCAGCLHFEEAKAAKRARRQSRKKEDDPAPPKPGRLTRLAAALRRKGSE